MGYKSAIPQVLQRRIEGQPPMPVRSAPRQAEANVGGAAAGTMREREVERVPCTRGSDLL